ncbi:MAG: cysteine desulfurase family protein [Acidobacteriota bacterium]
MRRVYLDHNATSPLGPEARSAMRRLLDEEAGVPLGNPSSPHASGHRARLVVEEARRAVSRLIGAAPSEVVFVSGGTEADNLAIQGIVEPGEPAHLVTSSVEHPAVLEACRKLRERGWELTVVGVDRDGRVHPDDVMKTLRRETRMVSIMTANNETGVIQPIREIAAGVRERGILFHTDAVQSVGKREIDVGALGVDYLAISSHKMGGPVGIGALYVREGAPLRPLLQGGGQERRRRPGTEAALLAAGFGAAADAVRLPGDEDRMRGLRDLLEAEVRRHLAVSAVDIGLVINGEAAPRVAGTSSMTFAGIDNEALVIKMDLAGYAISTGSACSTGSTRPSHVLSAMGLSSTAIASTVRISLGPSTTEEEIRRAAEALTDAVAELASIGRAPLASGAGSR